MISDSNRETRRTLLGGICAMVAAMGIGRFAYTPILPLMQDALPFTDAAAGAVASVNYAGYLFGALATVFFSPSRGKIGRLRLSLLVNIASTLGMGLTDDLILWMVLRFLSGFSSAGVFVLASGIVLEVLARNGRIALSGLLYGGVGAGIALTGVAVPLLHALGDWRVTWLGVGLIAAVLGLGLGWLKEGDSSARGSKNQPSEDPRGKKLLPWLTAAYFCEGLGYIVTATFLVALVQRMTGDAGLAAGSWILAGLAAVPSCTLWALFARRAGFATALVLAHLVQAVGIVLPVLLPNAIGALGGALFFGATMLGIVTLTLSWGRTLLPQHDGKVIAILTTSFGAGQIIAPVVAGWMAQRMDGFALPLTAAALVVAFGGLLIPVALALNSRK